MSIQTRRVGLALLTTTLILLNQLCLAQSDKGAKITIPDTKTNIVVGATFAVGGNVPEARTIGTDGKWKLIIPKVIVELSYTNEDGKKVIVTKDIATLTFHDDTSSTGVFHTHLTVARIGKPGLCDLTATGLDTANEHTKKTDMIEVTLK